MLGALFDGELDEFGVGMPALDWLWLMELWQATRNIPSSAIKADLNNFIDPLIVRYQNL